VAVHSGGGSLEVFTEDFCIDVSLRNICTRMLMNNNTLVHPCSSSTAIIYNKITCIE
jgi:hypothetical protein